MERLLNWPGSKWSLVEKIIEMLPGHNIYLEPFFGSGAVFFNKDKCNTEIINDLDGQVVNLFKVIRNNPEELATSLRFTPYSREEYMNSAIQDGDSEVERARKFIVRTNMARAGLQRYKTGWRHAGPSLGATRKQRVVGKWNRLPDLVFEYAERLKDAEIENQDAIELIKKYNREDCLLYVDPPYLLATRKQRMYNVEMEYEEQHEKLLDVLIKHRGPVILSGYDSELYGSKLDGWNKFEFKAQAEQGQIRTEVIWINYHFMNQMSLFDVAN